MWAEYTAALKLIPGHTAGTDYQIEVPLAQADPVTRRVGPQQPTTGGTPETEVFYTEDVWVLLTQPLKHFEDANQAGQMREFLASVIDGSPFTLDVYGSIASPDDPQVWTFDGTSYRERREGNMLRVFPFGIKRPID